MKSYENNMADQDVIVHSLRVLSEIKNPALSQLKRDVDIVQKNATALSQKQDKYWTDLASDGVITPIEKKIVLREMENIANSYTALYTQAVSEHYDTAPFFTDYMATYNALRNYLYYTLHLFDNMDAQTEVDREEFNNYFSAYYYSENFAIVSMTVGVITDLGFKILESLEDEGEEGEVGIYRGILYQYTDGEWKIINKELYYGKSDVLPPAMEGRYFLCTANTLLYDVLYVNDDPLELNGEMLEVGGSYEQGIIYVYENNHWQRKEPDEDYRYIVAMGDYYSVKQTIPEIIKSEVADIAREATETNYYGPLLVPPVNPQENDYFLYKGETSGETPEPRWVFASLYMFKNNDWVRLDESLAQNQKYYMEALQDILTITKSTTGYFSTIFCNAFFANDAAMNSLSLRVIYLQQDGVIRSINYEAGEEGFLLDADGNIDAMGDTHIGGKAAINVAMNDADFSDYQVIIGGNTKIKGNCLFTGKIDTDQQCSAAGFELKGLKAGDIMLRRLDIKNGKITWLIPASGTIRVKAAITFGNYRGGFLFIQKNGTTIKYYEGRPYGDYDVKEFTMDISYDFDIVAGDCITIWASQDQGGAAADGIVDFVGGICTATPNSLVTYLGQVISSNNPPSPAR